MMEHRSTDDPAQEPTLRGGDVWSVLLVEDSPGDALLLEEMLKRSGQAVALRNVETLAAAVAAVGSEAYDVVIGDLGLPDAQGLEVVDGLKRVASDLPLVVLTGLQDRPDVGVEAVRRGAQDYLVKGSATATDVERALRFAIERQRLVRLVTSDALQRNALATIEARGRGAATVSEVLEIVVDAVTEAMPRVRAEVAVEMGPGAASARAVSAGVRDDEGWGTERWPIATEHATGALVVASPPRHPLSPHDRSFLERVAATSGATLDALSALSDLELRSIQLEMLYAVSSALVECADIAEVLDRVPGLVLAGMRHGGEAGLVLHLAGSTAVVGAPPDEALEEARVAIVVDDEEVGELLLQGPVRRSQSTVEQIVLAQVAELVEAWVVRRQAERERDRRSRQMQLLLDQLPAVIWSVDTDLRFTSVTGSGLGGLDASPEVGDRLVDFFAGRSEFLPVDEHRRALQGEQRSYSFWWGERWWDCLLTQLHDPDGTITGALGVAMDATEQRRAQEQVARERERYQALFQHSRDAIVLTDVDGRFTEVNPAMCELVGRSREQLLGLRAVDLAPEGAASDFGTRREQLVQTGQLRGGLALARPDGTAVEVEFNASGGILEGVNLAILRDVTEQRRVQRALVTSEQRFRALADNAVEGIFRIGMKPDRAYEYVNPAFERITGYGLADLHEDVMLLRRRTHPEDSLADDESGPRAIRFRRADGEQRWLELRQTPIMDGRGEVVAVQGLVIDVTEHRRQAEALEAALAREQEATVELRRLDELKNAFLRAASHEMRTPLAAIYGISSTLHTHHDRLAPDKAGHLWDRLDANVERLRTLLDDLLDINRLTTEEVVPVIEEVDLAQLARRVAADVPLGHRTLELQLVPTPATIEPSKVERVLHNLLANVGRHTPEGTVATVATHPSADGAATLVVEDDGPGLDPDILDRVFEPFVPGQRAADSPRPGTGIGLSIVRQFTELHRGTVVVGETTDGGTRFQLTFPVAGASSPDLSPEDDASTT